MFVELIVFTERGCFRRGYLRGNDFENASQSRKALQRQKLRTWRAVFFGEWACFYSITRSGIRSVAEVLSCLRGCQLVWTLA